jgi:hypothetical protein
MTAPPTSAFYITGGTLPPAALSYVERACALAPLVALDRDLLQAGKYYHVLNPRSLPAMADSVSPEPLGE